MLVWWWASSPGGNHRASRLTGAPKENSRAWRQATSSSTATCRQWRRSCTRNRMDRPDNRQGFPHSCGPGTALWCLSLPGCEEVLALATSTMIFFFFLPLKGCFHVFWGTSYFAHLLRYREPTKSPGLIRDCLPDSARKSNPRESGGERALSQSQKPTVYPSPLPRLISISV